jgi:hypothetical protein
MLRSEWLSLIAVASCHSKKREKPATRSQNLPAKNRVRSPRRKRLFVRARLLRLERPAGAGYAASHNCRGHAKQPRHEAALAIVGFPKWSGADNARGEAAHRYDELKRIYRGY